jgi:hypothetical protein
MLINLFEATAKAINCGSKENPGMYVTAHLKPKWLAWILHRFFPAIGIELSVNYGEIEDGKLVMKGKAIWSAK